MSKYYIAKIECVSPIDGADRIQYAKVLGEGVVVSNELKVGDVGVFFTSDTQLSHEYASTNNLYRDKTKNLEDKSGFFDENRRVRCQTFMKVRSEGLFMPLESLAPFGRIDKLKVGDSGSEFGGVPICGKYYSEKSKKAISEGKSKPENKAKKQKDKITMFNEHVETNNFNQNTHLLQKGDMLSFHSKRHGTSGRTGFVLTKRQPSTWKEKLLNKVGLFNGDEWKVVTGSRRVVLSGDNDGYHGSNQFRFDITKRFEPYLEKGMTLYYEIVGYVNNKPIMGVHDTKNLKDKAFQKKYGDKIVYSYGCNEGEYDVFVYRISMTNIDGVELDFTDAQVKNWCESRGFKSTFDVHEPIIFDGDIDKLKELVVHLTEREDVLTEDHTDPRHISEGIIIRADGKRQKPLFLKSKSYAFKVLEGIFKEVNEDVEDVS